MSRQAEIPDSGFTNFMDSLDGQVTGSMAVTIAALSLALTEPWPLWPLVGSLLGFLLWNLSPAKVFMGDVGSTFLGAVFASLVLQSSSWPQAFGCLLVATPLLGDACLCVPRRWLAGQRLHQAGWSYARVSLAYIAATAVLALALLAGGWPWVFGHGRTVADGSRAQGDAVLGFLDDSHPADELVAGVPVIGALSLVREFKALPCPEGAPAPDRCAVAIGHPALRQLKEQVLEASGAPLGGVVHHYACVSPSAQLAPGCVVLAGSVVNADAQLERGGAREQRRHG